MSLIGEIVFDFLGELLVAFFGRVCHFTGRVLIFLLTLGYVRIPALRTGGADGGNDRDFGVKLAGFLFWLAAIALTLYLLLA